MKLLLPRFGHAPFVAQAFELLEIVSARAARVLLQILNTCAVLEPSEGGLFQFEIVVEHLEALFERVEVP